MNWRARLSPAADSEASEESSAPASKATRRRTIAVIKILWVCAVLGGSGWYLTTRWDEVVRYAGSVGLSAAVASILVLTVGRVLLAAISRSALAIFGTDISVARSFYINTLSQLGKYVPGAVWHLVGRVALYRLLGTSATRGSAALAVENGVLLGSGLLLGTGVMAPSLLGLLDRVLPHWSFSVLVALVAVGVWWLAVSQLGRRLVRRYGEGAELRSHSMFALSVSFWATFGLAFWLVLPAESRTLELVPIATGTFALAWVAGYLSPFAPAGLGVREAVIVALLGPVLGVPTAAATAAGGRLIWTIQELLTAPLAASKVARMRSELREADETMRGLEEGDAPDPTLNSARRDDPDGPHQDL